MNIMIYVHNRPSSCVQLKGGVEIPVGLLKKDRNLAKMNFVLVSRKALNESGRCIDWWLS